MYGFSSFTSRLYVLALIALAFATRSLCNEDVCLSVIRCCQSVEFWSSSPLNNHNLYIYPCHTLLHFLFLFLIGCAKYGLKIIDQLKIFQDLFGGLYKL